jgi:iron complex outermembrane receptor protein
MAAILKEYFLYPITHWVLLLTTLPCLSYADINDLDLDALMNADVQVTSAMKRSQSVSNTASSIYVLSNQDLINSGAHSIPEALGLVPGMQVRQIDNNQWAITARFAGGRYSSKLLVLIDGQSVYNTAFSGVYWESLDIPLHDIDRIEVIRGQTGTLWGVNASNGVINIITKNSADTRDNFASISGGSNGHRDLKIRHGGDLGERGSYRIFAHNQQGKESAEGFFQPNDSVNLNSIGIRSDYAFSDDVTLLSRLNILRSNVGQTSRRADITTRKNDYFNDVVTREKVDAFFKVDERLSKASNHMFQFAMSSERGEQAQFNEEVNAVDVDYQINTLIGAHQIDMGLNYRYNEVNFKDSPYTTDLSHSNHLQSYGGFFQAQLNVIPNTFHLIIGDMSSYHSYTGWEHQPSLRGVYMPSNRHNFWFNISEAVRVPSYLEYDLRLLVDGKKVEDFVKTGINLLDNYVLATYLEGNPNIEAEKSRSYELGYRLVDMDYSLDISVYRSESNNALSYMFKVDDAYQNAVLAALLTGNTSQVLSALNNSSASINLASASALTVSGVDAVLDWNISPRVNTELSYSVTNIDYDLSLGSIAPISKDSTHTKIMGKLNLQLPHNQFMFIALKSETGDTYNTGDIFTADIGWRWKVKPNIEVSVNGWNLLSNDNYEYLNTSELITSPIRIEKAYSASINVTF